ncbi:MAG: hypothetical protein ACRC2T_10640 [Thermoguttaceae bacterium]
MTHLNSTISIDFNEIERQVQWTQRQLKLSDTQTEMLRNNTTRVLLEKKKNWEKLVRDIVWSEAMLLIRSSRKNQILPLSEIDENSLAYNDRPLSELDIFEKAMRAVKMQEVIESLPEPKRSLCELLKYFSPMATCQKLGITQREFQLLCDELKVVFIAAGLEP